ncbi:MAG: biotin/lipoyl-binding protein [Oscillospiraceae bacterium]|nr:biotin/lipoyl-binding protein [Oscillospiraceae bacterium]
MDNNENGKMKKRGWVKNAAIIFLAVMLVLTFFSNTILNWSLPEVSGQYTGRGSISSGISGTGRVAANVAYNVEISEGREIEKVHVRQGDTVEAGDLLFTLSEKDSTEIEAAVEQLENMQYNYTVKVLNHVAADYDSSNENIANLREQLADAQAKFDARNTYQEAYDAAKAAAEEASDKVDELNEISSELSTAASQLNMNEDGGYEDVRAKLDEIEKLTEQLEDANDALSAMTTGSSEVQTAEAKVESAEAALEAAQDALDSAQDAWIDAEEAYEAADTRLDSYNNKLKDYNAEKAKLDAMAADDPGRTAQQDYVNALLADLGTKPDLKPYEKSLKDTETAYGKAADARSKAQTALADAKAELEKVKNANRDTNVSEEEYDAAQALVKSLTKEKTQAEKDLKKLVSAAQSDIKSKQKENDAALKEARKAAEEANSKLNDAQKELNDNTVTKETVDNLQKQLESAISQLEKQKNSDSRSEKLFQMELDNAMKDINKQKENIDKMRASSISTEVTAKYSGTISSVNVMAGDTVNKGETLCQIEVNGKGYTVSISVTNEQASTVKVGDEATVNNFWWGNISVTLAAIKADRTNPSTKKLLEFDVEGDVTDGQNLELTIGKKNTSYSNVVPNSAIREDSEGKFVLIAVPKSTPLGNRYVATRQNVTVLESDDYNSAIDTGTSYGYDYIIVSSSKPIEAGTQVRLVDN